MIIVPRFRPFSAGKTAGSPLATAKSSPLFPPTTKATASRVFFVSSTRKAAGSPLVTEKSSPFSHRPRRRRRLVFFRFFNAKSRRVSARHREELTLFPPTTKATAPRVFSSLRREKPPLGSPSGVIPFRDIRQCPPPRLREPLAPNLISSFSMFLRPRSREFRQSLAPAPFSPHTFRQLFSAESRRPPFFGIGRTSRTHFAGYPSMSPAPFAGAPRRADFSTRNAAAWLSKRRRAFLKFIRQDFSVHNRSKAAKSRAFTLITSSSSSLKRPSEVKIPFVSSSTSFSCVYTLAQSPSFRAGIT